MFSVEQMQFIRDVGPVVFGVIVAILILYTYARVHASRLKSEAEQTAKDKEVERTIKTAREQAAEDTRQSLNRVYASLIEDARQREARLQTVIDSQGLELRDSTRALAEAREQMLIAKRNYEECTEDISVITAERDVLKQENKELRIERQENKRRLTDVENLLAQLQREFKAVSDDRENAKERLEAVLRDNAELKQKLTSIGHEKISNDQKEIRSDSPQENSGAESGGGTKNPTE